MDSYARLLAAIRRPYATERFNRLYGHREGSLAFQITRYSRLVKAHEDIFHDNQAPLYMVSAPGRTEIGGNHTDHNNGCVLAAAVNLDTLACVSKTEGMTVRIHSEGYPELVVDLTDMDAKEEEKGTSAALVRGVARGLRDRGFQVGGFHAAVVSSVMGGSGLSSSAAYEVMISRIFEALYNGKEMDATSRAQLSQYAENEYFGKPSGLMDQMACSTGGLVNIDFKGQPKVKPLQYNFASHGYQLVVVAPGGSHDNLTDEYAAIRTEMQDVASFFGEKTLRGVRPEQLLQNMQAICRRFSERAVLRAMHFFQENERVKQQVHALQLDDLPAFFAAVNASGKSSWTLLQNIYPAGSTSQALALALALSETLLQGKGACRVHGGGFAGTTLNFVPEDMVNAFVSGMEQAFGPGCCVVLDVRQDGPCTVFTSEEN
ncbi:MAG: galactokinase [Clostridia bacterium]|nr:galactokinase [Clostridia bacterium]